MATKFKCNLFDTNSIQQLINDLNYYKGVTLDDKCKMVAEELAEIGMRYAEHYKSLNNFGKHIKMSYYPTPIPDGYRTVLVATEMGTILVKWKGKGGVDRVEEVSPLLMAEYGSGLKARPTQSIEGGEVGQGTFPNQTHATDPNGWWWKDENGNWCHSTGVLPTMPMYMSMTEMFDKAERVVQEAFRR